MKLQLPDSVVKIKGKLQLSELIFPCGTLYQHTPSGMYFRFMSRGGRWNTEYLITTEKGFFVKGGFAPRINTDQLYKLIYTNPDKTTLVKKFVEELEKQNARNDDPS